MKSFRFLAVLSLLLPLLATGVQAEDGGEIAIDLSTGIKANFAEKIGAEVQVANDELENVPVLRVTVPEGEFERWRGSIRLPVPNPARGSYTVTFEARFEPDENTVGMRVFDFSGEKAVEIAPRKMIRVSADWQEFVFEFPVESEGVAPTVTWTDLALSGKTFSLRNVRLIRN